jgi:hypothetical protein
MSDILQLLEAAAEKKHAKELDSKAWGGHVDDVFSGTWATAETKPVTTTE